MLKIRIILFKTETVLKKLKSTTKISRGFIFVDKRMRQILWKQIVADLQKKARKIDKN